MKTIADILVQEKSISKLIKRTKFTESLALVFKQSAGLEANFIEQCQFAEYRDTVLIIVTTNTALATKIRYMKPEIIKNLKIQPEFSAITSVKCIVDSLHVAKTRLVPKPRPPSEKSRKIWQRTIDEVKHKA